MNTKLGLFCILISASLLAQQHPKTNMEMLTTLIDSSFLHISGKLTSQSELKIISTGNQAVLYSNIQAAFARLKAHETVAQSTNGGTQLLYTIEDARIVYDNLSRDGIFGDAKITRRAILRGNILITPGDQNTQPFNFSSADTIRLESRQEVESGSYSFLSPNVPANTTFDTIWEPAAIIAAIGVAVYLLFSVRKTD